MYQSMYDTGIKLLVGEYAIVSTILLLGTSYPFFQQKGVVLDVVIVDIVVGDGLLPPVVA